MIQLVSRLLPLAMIALASAGCQTIQYYQQAIRGEYQILSQRRPIAELLADPDLNPKLKEKFGLIIKLRQFAETELKLPVDQHYLAYVDLNRRFAVFNVHAAPQFSLQPRAWWYPFVGHLKYRGYFAETAARKYGEALAAKGDDVYVEGIEAFSTLGWFADPLLNTFIFHSEPELAEILFHELAHQRLFLKGDTDFNEAFATVVAEEGVRRWFLAKNDTAGYQRYATDLEHNRQFVRLIMNTRELLQALFGDSETPENHYRPNRGPAPPWMKEEKERILTQLREDYRRLKASWGNDSGYDGWFSKSLNNAQLNTISVYYELVPGFQALLRTQGNDLERFYKAVREMRKLSKDERHRRLQSYADENHKP